MPNAICGESAAVGLVALLLASAVGLLIWVSPSGGDIVRSALGGGIHATRGL